MERAWRDDVCSGTADNGIQIQGGEDKPDAGRRSEAGSGVEFSSDIVMGIEYLVLGNLKFNS